MAASISRVTEEEPLARARWHDLAAARIPEYALAVLEALRFDGAGSGRLEALGESDWTKALKFCDQAQLTLTLNHVCRDALPEWVRNRIDQNIRTYSVRFHRLEKALLEIADVLDARGIEFVVLKGLAHAPEFTPDPLLRAQGDIDLWCEKESLYAARDALFELGYRVAGPSRGRHLPPMIRESDWEWRGDYYASDLPVPVELHYQLWDEEAESIRVPAENLIWQRRTTLSIDGHEVTGLLKPDALAFACLHLLMHVLHGDLRLQRAWEIANFLHSHVHREGFWSLWRQCHQDSLRQLEAIVFQLVSDWFGVDLPPAAEEELGRLPGDVKLWMERHALSPVEALFHANKDEIWLHLSLVESFRDKLAVFLRRILPLRVPERVDAGTVNNAPPTPAEIKLHRRFMAARTLHHARALVPALLSGARWYWARTRLGSEFLRLQAASSLFNFGVLIFFLLYNLYLLGLGYHENLMGQISGCLSLGTVLGAIPGAALSRRVGLRNTLLIAILGSAAACFLRTVSTQEAWLLATALMNGLFLSLWAISFSPTVAGFTNKQNRQFAFGFACSLGVSIGVLGGLVGGHLPSVVGHVLGLPGSLGSTRAALVVASAVAALAALPAAGLRFPRASETGAKVYPRSRFLIGFLAALCCWSAAVGAFNPLFNAFFAGRVRMSVQHIGLVLSFSQVSQVLAMLSAPLILKRLGEVRGIACMQLATGMMLAFLAFSPGAWMAAAGYAGYMGFQYMSEPGLLGMLMGRVAPAERSGASSLYFMVISLAGSASATAAGGAVVRFGYPSVLVVCALIAALAAFLFRTLIHEQACAITSATSS